MMTAAVERGWNTFVFLSENQQLAIDWSSEVNSHFRICSN